MGGQDRYKEKRQLGCRIPEPVLPSEGGSRLLRGFEVFCHFQHFGDGVPVATGAGCVQGFVNARPGKFGLAHTVREVDVEFAAGDVQFFGCEFLFLEGFARCVAGIAGQEGDQEFTGLNVGSFCKGISGDHTAKFGRSAKNDVGVAGEFLFGAGLNALGNHVEFAFAGFEDDVSALQVGLRTVEFKRSVKGAESVHLDFAVTADVDGAEHGNKDRHGVVHEIGEQ